MRIILFCGVLLASGAGAQTVSPIDLEVMEKFRLASSSGDASALEALLSDNVTVNVMQQMGPNGPIRQVPEGKGKTETVKQYENVLAAAGKPADATCDAADGVSVFCQYRFDQPGRDMQTMIMFDGKKIGALMVKYGGAAVK